MTSAAAGSTIKDRYLQLAKPVEELFRVDPLGREISKAEAQLEQTKLKIHEILGKFNGNPPNHQMHPLELSSALLREKISLLKKKQSLPEKPTRSEAIEKENGAYLAFAKENINAIRVLAEERIWQLFGGRSGFEKLPVLDIGNRLSAYLGFIRPEEMTAPIMRGKDQSQREFFALKVVKDGVLKVQTFHRRYTNELLWVSTMGNTSSDVLMLSAGIMMLDTYEDLSKLIAGTSEVRLATKEELEEKKA